ncbi:hypothetical protein ONS95_006548 [Cadophora gregata]|uniref:uncharacterized protein n=1 Tax=Cadophora gregata TaxID=51156 RepID=UPI0026DB7510|nr:uncharacterized protein ONS95_006548 [Cadophora gregata]KAK0101373.1 hypothetical protein ONS95_006548 [Cadophora gregata]
MRIYMTAMLAELILAYCARAVHSEFLRTNSTFYSNTTIVGNTTTTLPFMNTTGVFCKRDGTSCNPKSQTPQVNITGNWNDLDQPEIEDIDYFRFSSKNIILSRADDWYAAWTVARQNDTDWAELGEWKLFAKDFAQTYNFECDLTFGACVNYPSLGDLQRMWPGAENRPLVRRIFFTFNRFAIAHGYVRAIDEAYDRTHTYLIGMVPEIISTFTLQVYPAKKLKCDQLHTFVSMMVNIGIQLAQVVLVGFLGPEMGVLSVEVRAAMEELAALEVNVAKTVEQTMVSTMTSRMQELKKTISDAQKNVGKLNWLTTLGPLDQRVKNTQIPRNFMWSNVLMFNFGYMEMMAYNDLKKVYNFNNQFIGPGIGHGTMCSEFEGDFVDNNAGNRDNLVARLSSVFESSRKQRQAMFKALYQGYIMAPGEPSATAMWLKSRDWTGPGSVLEEMRDISELEEEVKMTVIKSLITDTLTSDFNYIKCGYKDDAAAHCEKAKDATKGQDLSVFCPHADTDPQFMCDSRRWYFSDLHQHDIPMVAAKKFETFAGNRFNFTRQKFLMESFRNYELYTHAKPTDYGGWGYGNSTSKGIGFNLPVCVSAKPRFFERKGYPSICGDWHASETESFIGAMNAGVNSTIYKYRKDSMPMYLYTEVIPQALDSFQPLTRYLGLCANSLRFPNVGETPGVAVNWLKIQLSKDKDCELVQNGTRNLVDEEAANRWFCTNAGGHTIFKREKPYVDSPHAKYMKSHKRRCKSWLKNHGTYAKNQTAPGR